MKKYIKWFAMIAVTIAAVMQTSTAASAPTPRPTVPDIIQPTCVGECLPLQVEVLPAEPVCTDKALQVTVRVTNPNSVAVRAVVVRASTVSNGAKLSNETFALGQMDAGEVRDVRLDITTTTGAAVKLNLTAESPDLTTASCSCICPVLLFKRCHPYLVVKKTGRAEVVGGAKLKYLVTVKNIGDGTARGVYARDFLPRLLSIAKMTPGSSFKKGIYTKRVRDIAPGKERTFWVYTKAANPLVGLKCVTNRVIVYGDDFESIPATAKTCIKRKPIRPIKPTG